jgi:hypothetical protein
VSGVSPTKALSALVALLPALAFCEPKPEPPKEPVTPLEIPPAPAQSTSLDRPIVAGLTDPLDAAPPAVSAQVEDAGIGMASDGSVHPHGGLRAEAIQRVVFAHRGALQACYEIEAQKDPTLNGGITAAWTVDPSGTVTDAAVTGSTIRNAHVEGCVLRQVQAWRFPTSDSVSRIQAYPFSFGIRR